MSKETADEYQARLHALRSETGAERMARMARINAHDAREAAEAVEMIGVREYAEGYPVRLTPMSAIGELEDPRYRPSAAEGRRWVISATNEGGHNGVSIDLAELVAWLRTHRPELLS